MQEIERKFKLDTLPKDLDIWPSKELIAGYFKDPADGKSTRIRQEGDEYFLVKKSGRGLAKDIGPGDKKITKEEFDLLWPLTEGWRIFKTRRYITCGKHIIELDIYIDFPGFYTAEVEFTTVEEANAFNPPSWFGNELTDDNRYSNKKLARYGLPKDIPEYE